MNILHRRSKIRYDAAVLAALAVLCAALMLYHARSALTVGDRVLAAPPDSLGYFVYLPAVLLRGTLETRDAITGLLAQRPDLAAAQMGSRTPTNLTSDKYPVGSAVLWAPFFLAAHAGVLLAGTAGLPIAPDGVGGAYQTAVAAGSVVYGVLAFWLVYRTTRLVARPGAALAATVVLWLAGNTMYYMTMEPIFAHVPSFFLVAAATYRWLGGEPVGQTERPGYWLFLGLVGGLLLSVRKLDALAIVPLVAFGAAGWWTRHGEPGWMRRAATAGLGLAAGVLGGYLPQLIVQAVLYGSPLVDGYALSSADYFDFWHPRLAFTLLSTHRGLFLWHPVYLVGLVGLAAGWRANPRAAIAGWGFFLAVWLAASAWSSPEQGNSFGGRFFIATTPFLAIGLAHLLSLGRPWRPLVWSTAGLLIGWNMLFFLQYALNLLPHDAPLTLDDLFAGKLRLVGHIVALATRA